MEDVEINRNPTLFPWAVRSSRRGGDNPSPSGGLLYPDARVMTANRQVLSARVAEWDRQKGYGFLDSGRERIFLHRRDFVKWHRPPAVGENIQYSLGRDANGRGRVLRRPRERRDHNLASR